MQTARYFQGYSNVSYTAQNLWDVDSQNDASLLDVIGDKSIRLLASREVRGLMADMEKLSLGQQPDVKYKVYSAHDSNIARWMYTIAPTF